MASIMKRGDSYSVRYKYKDHSGKPCEGWESFKTRKEAQERKNHGRERIAGRHIPRPRHHDGRGDVVQMDPDPVHKAQVVPQDLHPVRGDGAKPYRAVYREAESAGAANLRH